jgi:hypothetical protein
LEAIDAALAAANPDLGENEQRLAVVTLRLLTSGAPVAHHEIAVASGLPAEQVEDTLRSLPLMFRDDDGQVVGFSGLALSEMPHRIRRLSVDLYAWCAWDPLFLARIIGDLEVATRDPATSEAISYRIGGDGIISDLSHPDGVMSFVRPGTLRQEDVIGRFCHFIHHFSSLASARRWTAEHPGTFTIGLDDAVELARRHVMRNFAKALR